MCHEYSQKMINFKFINSKIWTGILLFVDKGQKLAISMQAHSQSHLFSLSTKLNMVYPNILCVNLIAEN